MAISNIIVEEPEPLTTSTSKISTIKGSHKFRIEGFSYRKGLGVGKYIASDTFSVGGYLWEIRFYPDGKVEAGSGEEDDSEEEDYNDEDIYVSLFAELVSECEKDLRVSFEFYLLDQNGKMESNEQKICGSYTINDDNPAYGYNHFYKREDLEASKFIKDDSLTIQCSVMVANTYLVSPKILTHSLPLSNLKQSYEQLLESKDGSDISFDVEGEIFSAHKLILSTRSPVFKANFYGHLKDDNNRCIKIEEMKAPVFKALLHFIYCGVIPDFDSDYVASIMIQHLLAAADRYGIQTLKSLCESRLCENIAIESVFSTIDLAEQHGCFQLKSSCLEFIGHYENLEAVMQTDEFKNLSESCPALILEILKICSSRKSVNFKNKFKGHVIY